MHWRDRITNAELYGDLPRANDIIRDWRLHFVGHAARCIKDRSATYIYIYIYTTLSASRVFALVDGRKKQPAQVAEGQGDWHKLEQDAATGMQLALGQNTVHI